MAPVRRQPEKQEQAAIVKLLRSLGASVYILGTRRPKGDYQGTMQTPGIPDLYAVLPVRAGLPGHRQLGYALWVEVTAPKGRPTEAQRQFKVESELACIDHLVGGVDTVVNWLTAGGWLK